MKKIILILFLSFFIHNTIIAQTDSVKVQISKQLTLQQSKSIFLYKFSPTNSCNQSKAVSILYEKKVSTCFDLIRKLNSSEIKKLFSIIKSAKSYGVVEVACFDTEYALLVFNQNNIVVGYINISFSCNKLISNPIIKEREQVTKEGYRQIGFSKTAYLSLLKLLRVN